MFFVFLFITFCCGNVWTPFQKKSSCNEDFCVESELTIEGEIVAFSDHDNDRQTEAYVISNDKKTIRTVRYDNENQKFVDSKFSMTFDNPIVNVIPVDILFRGLVDVIIQTQTSSTYNTYACYNNSAKLECSNPITMKTQVNVYDLNGDNYVDMIGIGDNGTTVWMNNGDKTFYETSDYNFPSYDSNFPITFVDVNGDCRSDLLFVVKENNAHTIQIYSTQQKNDDKFATIHYENDRNISLTTTISNILVGDFNRDGNMDLLWAINDNTIHIQMNKQKFQLCLPDSQYTFNDSTTVEVVLPENYIFSISNSLSYMNIGDYNIDGYPDILVHVEHKDNSKSFAIEEEAQSKIKSVSGNATSGAFFDDDDRGMLNIFFNVEETTNGATTSKVTVISNNMKPDALFAKIVGLNGVCFAKCGSGYSKPDEKAYGSSYYGGSFRLTLTNTKGNNVGLAAQQISRTSFKSLQLPYAHIGLGRISNYIQSVEFGTNMNVSVNHAQFQSIIPNSQLVVIPHPPTKASKWTIELYFLDIDLMFWISIAMAIALVILGIIMLVLFIREKKKEAKRNLLNMK
ncbi:T-cell immunomodulatory protein [Entamoeba marina]